MSKASGNGIASSTAGSVLRISRKFDDIGYAFRFISGFLVALVILYALFAFAAFPRGVVWENVASYRSGLFLDVQYDETMLRRFFPDQRVKAVKESADRFLKSKRNVLLEQRRTVLENAAEAACLHGDLRHSLPPRLLRRLMADEDLKVFDDDGEEVAVRCGLTDNLASVSDTELAKAQMNAIVDYLKLQIGDAGGQAKIYLQEALKGIEAHQKAVNSVLEDVKARIRALEYDLDFQWLGSEGATWIVHLIVWSWLGLVANTLIGAMKALKENTYSGVIAVFFFPKLILSPLVAIPVIATIAYGITDVNLRLSNQPMFLLVAFSSGFASEGFNGLLQRAVNAILAAGRADSEKLRATGRAIALVEPSPPANRNMRSLRDFEDAAREQVDYTINKAGVRIAKAKLLRGDAP